MATLSSKNPQNYIYCLIYQILINFIPFFLQLLALQKEQDELMTGNGNGGNPPKVNICPPSPQNNDPDKTGNFSQ